jgi:hypothetical protein
MSKELLLEVPARLQATGTGQIAGPARLANHDFSQWRCRCRLEAVGGRGAAFEFARDGSARLELPADAAGTLVGAVELAEPDGGTHLVGAFQLTVEPDRGQSERAVVYQPLTGYGRPASGALVADKVMLRIPLAAERASRAVPLADLLTRERCLQLPNRGDGNARVLSVHAGETTVLGRCYASQLRGQARGYLERLGESSIHWVTLWDDRWVNKLSARLRYRDADGRESLEIRNVTDYSQARNDLLVTTRRQDGQQGEQRLAPGKSLGVPLAAQTLVTVGVGEGEHRRQLVACRFVEARLGKLEVRIPAFKTERSEFRFPPEDPAALTMHFLGIWLPLPLERLEHLLTQAQEPLALSFPREAVYLWIRYRHARKMLTVTSNESLQDGLAK